MGRRICQNPKCYVTDDEVNETGYCSVYCSNVVLYDLERKNSPVKCNHVITHNITGECWECGEKKMTEEIKSDGKKFWMIARVRVDADGFHLKGQPSVQHLSFEDAMNEAKRLASSFTDSSFIVLESTHEVKTELPPVVVNTIE